MEEPPSLIPEPMWEKSDDDDDGAVFAWDGDVDFDSYSDAMYEEEDTDARRWDPLAPTPLFAASADGRVMAVETLLNAREDSQLNAADKAGRTALCMACLHGRVEVVRLLVAAGADVNIADKHGGRPLCRSSGQGHAEIVQMLIAAGADVNARDSWGWIALSRASHHGHTTIVKSLLDGGADVSLADTERNTPLHRAVGGGHTEIVELLISAGAKVNIANKSGQTVLHAASSKNNTEVVAQLIAAGADVNAVDEYEESALYHASSRGNTVVTTMLLSNGANVNKQNSAGETPLYRAAANDCATVVQRLLAAGAMVDRATKLEDTPLYQAARQGYADIVEQLLKAGAQVNTTVRNHTALYSAAMNGHAKVVEQLAAAGADVNAGDEDGETALHRACQRGHTHVVAILLSNGADVNKQNCEGETPLFQASLNKRALIARLLLAAGVIVDLRTKGHETALYRASYEGIAEVVELLLKAGADINTRDKNGETPLICASCARRESVVRLLLDAGALVDMVGEDGRSALHCARSVDVANMLITANADVNALDKNGQTPLDVLSEESCYDIVNVLLQGGAKTKDGAGLLHRVLLEFWKDGRLELKPVLLQTIQTLASIGVNWDDSCESIVQQRAQRPRGTTPADGVRWRREAPAISVCFLHWVRERNRGRRLTHVPIEQVRKGELATRTYIREIIASREVIHRRKICVVGPSFWGKTSLVKSLTEVKPSLVHPDDRTIGIDHFKLSFEDESADDKHISHEVTFWDFAGQDAYQVVHSLFFSARTLYIVCIDLEAYAIARLQAELMIDLESQTNRFMNDFLDTKVLRWIRMIFARQPDAEFVFVATKSDRVQDTYLPAEDRAVEDLKKRLANVMVIVEDMKRSRVLDSDDRLDDRPLVTHLWDPTLAKMHDKPHVPVIISSCATAETVATLVEDIQNVIRTSDRGYPMPEKYSLVLSAVLRMRLAAARLATDARLVQSFVHVDQLVEVLQDEVQDPLGTKIRELYLDATTCRSILQTLHDLGDILWYEDIGDLAIQKTIILDPLLMIDFVRQVITHKHSTETMPHSKLKGLPFWVTLDEDGFLYMKRVLQYFYLVYATTDDMEWDSDLIVPAYWKSNTCAFWKFGGDILRLERKTEESDITVRLHWQFHFTNEFPDSLFDSLVVASYAPTYPREVGPDWILYQHEKLYACRIVLGRDYASVQRVVHLEAVLAASGASEAEDLWMTFEYLSSKLERVLRGFPGLSVTSFATNRKDQEYSLKTVLVSPASPDSRKWMPPAASWTQYRTLADIKRAMRV